METREGMRVNLKASRLTAWLAALCLLAGLWAFEAQAARIKDIASFSGVRNNQLIGYGLVVGLSGTGDRRGSDFTIQSMVNMLEKMGVKVDKKTLKPANVAAVMVTAQMPTSARPGSKLDVTISSLGDSTSLLGGVLLVTPLKGLDGSIYGVAQGALAVGGVTASGPGASASKNVTTVGLIPNGATIEKAVPFEFNQQNEVVLNLQSADFSTALNMAGRINSTLGGNFAKATDAGTIKISVPDKFRGNMVPLMASLENIEINPDSRARVVVDEKTGTVILGQNTQLTRVGITHGNLQILVQENANVSQPMPFSAGRTEVTPDTNIAVKEENRKLRLVEGATLQELVEGLNALGSTPRDLISILRALKSSGALHADLEVI